MNRLAWLALSALSVLGCEESLGSGGETEPVDSAAVWITNEVQDQLTIDFCVRGASSWLGPVMQTLQSDKDGMDPGQQVGPMSIAAGMYEARLVDPETALCMPPFNDENYVIELPAAEVDVVIRGNAFPMPGDDPITVDVTTR